MNLTELLLPVALMGAEWVLWLLVVLSVVSVTIMIERAWYFHSTGVDIDALLADLKLFLGKSDVAKARDRVKSIGDGIEGSVAQAGLLEFSRGTDAVERSMASAKSRQKLKLERNLAFLGTLGNNAPFVGLLGTVIGVVKAFHDLASKKGAGPEVVMGSISEALVATAVGLFVAIPAVVAYNWFNRKVRARLAATEALSQLLLSHTSSGDGHATSGSR